MPASSLARVPLNTTPRNFRDRDVDTARQRRTLMERHLQDATALLYLVERGRQPVALPDRDGRAVTDEKGTPMFRPLTLPDLAGVATALDKAVRLQRLAMGLPTIMRQQDVVMRQTIEEVNTIMEEVVATIETYVCNECRDKIADRLEQIGRQRAAVAGAVI